MLDKYTIICCEGISFEQYSKNFNVNMEKNRRMVHKKDGCYYSKGMYRFIPFDNLDEVRTFEKTHNIEFSFCANCFKQGRN